MVTAAKKTHHAGTRTFYVSGFQQRYTVQRIARRGWFCTCPDFTCRGLPEHRHCKHIAAAQRYLLARATDFSPLELAFLLAAVDQELVALRHASKPIRHRGLQ